MLRFSGYNGVFAATLLFGLLLVSAVNAILDPYGLIDLVSVTGFNEKKPHGRTLGDRIVKSIKLGIRDYDALILGTSRAGALSTTHPFFQGARVFNGALAQTNMMEIGKVYDHAVAHQDLRTLLIGLDFLTFTDRRGMSRMSRLAFSGQSPWWLLAKTLPSGETLELSWDTLSTNRQPASTNSTDRISGFLELRRAWIDSSARRAFENEVESFLKKPDRYGCYHYDTGRVDILANIARNAHAVDVRVVAFISPVHAHQLEAIRARGLYGTFERWKRDMIVALGPEATLWDFSGYNTFTTEAVPQEDKPMRWYYESSHYREALAEIVLDTMAGILTGASDFGVRLTRANIDAHLAAVRAARKEWATTHPEDIAKIRALEEKVKQKRRCKPGAKRGL